MSHEGLQGVLEHTDFLNIAVRENFQHEGLVNRVILRDGEDTVFLKGLNGLVELATFHGGLGKSHQIAIQGVLAMASGPFQSGMPISTFNKEIQSLDVALLQELIRLILGS